MMSLILVALISIIIGIIMMLALMSAVFVKVDRVIELLEEDEDDDAIDCPHCKSVNRLFVAIHWNMNMPDVGQCPECTRTWKKINTKEFPHLKEIK